MAHYVKANVDDQTLSEPKRSRKKWVLCAYCSTGRAYLCGRYQMFEARKQEALKHNEPQRALETEGDVEPGGFKERSASPYFAQFD